ncbi:MAG: hypothetical protein LBV76_02190 [Deltaproteobacteria bacterium]|nr:hypothetical protein [Deltaproteobacteria bacterium]
MNGPALALVAGRLDLALKDGKDVPIVFAGSMERSCMVGLGEIELTEAAPGGLRCKGSISGSLSEKGRIKAILPCGNSDFLLLTLSNKGPDQGMGLAHFARAEHRTDKTEHMESSAVTRVENLIISEEAPLVLFYHPWDVEAKRRLVEVLLNMAEILPTTK